MTVAGPAAELGPDHELRADPGHATEVPAPAAAVVLRRWRVERRLLGDEWLHRREQALAGRRREAGADLAGKAQLAVLVHPDRDRPEIARVAFARRPAADDELLLGTDLELQPGRRPATRLIARAPELRDDPLEALAARRGHERLAVADDVRRIADAVRLAQDAAQESLSILEGDAEERAPVEIEQIERLEDERTGRRGPGPATGRARPAFADPFLEEREVGPAVLVERDDLAVDDRLAGVDPGRGREQARKVRLAVLEAARPELARPIADDGFEPIAVPLDLEQPIGIIERLRGEGREHRLDPIGH